MVGTLCRRDVLAADGGTSFRQLLRRFVEESLDEFLHNVAVAAHVLHEDIEGSLVNGWHRELHAPPGQTRFPNSQEAAPGANTVTGPLNLRRHPKAAPVDQPWADPRLDQGIKLFNEGQHWHAHEALEPLWMGLEGDDKLFVQGIIMAAAMLVQYEKRVARGVANHWANVQERLPSHAPNKWGIDVADLLLQLHPYVRTAASGQWGLRAGDVQIRRA